MIKMNDIRDTSKPYITTTDKKDVICTRIMNGYFVYSIGAVPTGVAIVRELEGEHKDMYKLIHGREADGILFEKLKDAKAAALKIIVSISE